MLKKLVMAAIAGLTLCGAVGSAVAAEYMIGIVAGTTGPAAWAGQPITNGALLAIDDVNKSGMLGFDTLTAEVQDTGSAKAQALTIVNRYAFSTKSLLIFGPTSAYEALTTAPVATKLEIPQFAVSLLPAVADVSPWSFIGGVDARKLTADLAKFGVAKLGVKRCALVYGRDNDGFVALAGAVREVFKEAGLQISEDTIVGADSDFLGIATKIAGQKPDCVFIITAPDQGANIVVQAKQAGLSDDVKILGVQSMAAPAWTDIGGSAVEGSYVEVEWNPSGLNEEARAFIDNYTKRYGIKPTNYSALAYQMMKAVAVAIKTAGPNPTRASVREALAKTPKMKGILGQGMYGIDANRRGEFDGVLLQVVQGQWRAVAN
jgi:branched-chain amino acid transport system substrate-binding protein